MMKNSPRTSKRWGAGGGAGAGAAVELGVGHLTIHLPDPCVLRVVARSVLLAAAILSFPWLRNVLPPASIITATVDNAEASRWVDDPLYLPMLLRDLRREGLLPGHEGGLQSSSGGASNSSVFLGDPGLRLQFLKRNKMVPISPEAERMADGDRSIDFVLAADGLDDASFEFVERVLRIGGVAAVRLSWDQSKAFHLPWNYRIVYIRWFGSTIVAIKKIAHAAAAGEDSSNAADMIVNQIGRRRLLAVPGVKKTMINGLEDALLEPPPENVNLRTLRMRTKYLPDLIRGSLDEYPRRLFIDVGPPGGAGSANWFKKQYPKKNSNFEIIRLDMVDGLNSGKERLAGISEWLRRNVKEEEYIVMKAEAEVVEEMVAEKVTGLVDELFMECDHQWQKGKGRRSKRAYWECLALFGRLRNEGVAVHQWWG